MSIISSYLILLERLIHPLLLISCRGFYLNKSNRTTFDPSPAVHPHFAHELFFTICDVSANVRSAWATVCEESKHFFSAVVPGPLDNFIQGFTNFKADLSTLPTSAWIIPNTQSSEGFSAAKHGYDIFRAQEFMSDLCGADELSTPREW